MSKREKCKFCGKLIEYHDYTYDDSTEITTLLCDEADIKRHAANGRRNAKARANRAAMKDAMDSVGMKRVRGALGGTYHE